MGGFLIWHSGKYWLLYLTPIFFFPTWHWVAILFLIWHYRPFLHLIVLVAHEITLLPLDIICDYQRNFCIVLACRWTTLLHKAMQHVQELRSDADDRVKWAEHGLERRAVMGQRWCGPTDRSRHILEPPNTIPATDYTSWISLHKMVFSTRCLLACLSVGRE